MGRIRVELRIFQKSLIIKPFYSQEFIKAGGGNRTCRTSDIIPFIKYFRCLLFKNRVKVGRKWGEKNSLALNTFCNCIKIHKKQLILCIKVLV